MANFDATVGNDTFNPTGTGDTLTVKANGVINVGDVFNATGTGDTVVIGGTAGGLAADFSVLGSNFSGWQGVTLNNTSGTDSATFLASQIGSGTAFAVKGSFGLQSVVVNMDSTTFDASHWTFTGWSSNDHLVINGTAGNDTITGSSQTLSGDSMVGGGGNDTYYVNSNYDTVVGGAGVDTVHTTATSWNAGTVGLNTFGANVENIILDGTANISATGNTLANTITGNSGNNTLNDGGAGGADTMTGGLGNDTYVVNNAGDQTIELDKGGTDTVQASISWSLNNANGAFIENLTLTGSNSINGTGNSLNNLLTGNSSVNTLNGAGGNDTLNGGQGADVMIGGAGNDTYFVDNASDTCVEGMNAGKDTVNATVSYLLGANVENLVLSGSSAIDGKGNELKNLITGNSAANLLTGMAGNDTLNGGHNSGAFASIGDTMDGGAGNDTYTINNLNDSIINEAAGTGAGFVDTVNVTVNNYVLSAANIEKVFLSGTASTITVTATSDIYVTGSGSANNITTSSGNDTINGGLGADTMNGGTGNDKYFVDNAGDVVNDTGGTDTVSSSISFSLLTNATGIENLILTGTAKNGTGDNNANTLTGNTLANLLTGNGGDDIIDGGKGIDTMVGGAGNDTYYVDNAKDVVDESSGSGTDSVISSISFSLSDATHALGTIENLTLTGSASINATGNTAANVLNGNSGNNILSDGGGVGVDTMAGGAGDDTYFVNVAGDVVTEGANAGTDTIVASISYSIASLTNIENLTLAAGSSNINATGNTNDNTIVGNSGNNVILADAGNDTINGGGGNDTITGGAGVDQMAGGGGNDTFVFSALTDSGTTLLTADVIQDFALAGSTDADKIDLSAIDANSVTGGDQAFTLATSGTAIGTAVLTSDGAGGQLISLYTDNSGVAKMVIDVQGVLNGASGLSASDFVL